MSPDGPEQRLTAAEEREQERLDALDLEQQLADEARDNPPLTEAEYDLAEHTAHFLDLVSK